MLFFFMRTQNPDADLIDFSNPTAEAGKGVAEELLIDLQVEESLEDHNKMLRLSDDHEKLMDLLEDFHSLCNVHTAQINVHRSIENDTKPDTTEELLIDLEMKVAELEGARLQSRIQTPEKVESLDSLGEKLLIDMSPAELDGYRFQSDMQILDTIGYLENMEIFDGSDLRISTNLDDLPEIRGDNSELNGLLETVEVELGIVSGIDNVHLKKLHHKVKLCWLFVIKNSVFNDNNCAQKLFCWKKKKKINSRGYKCSMSLLINLLEKGAAIFFEHGFLLIITATAPNGSKCTLKSNVLYFRLLKTGDMERRVKRRLEQQRSKEVTKEMSMLIVQNGEKVWGEKRIGNKVDMLAQVVGYRHKINTGGDSKCMKMYLTRISKSNRGLNLGMLEEIEVRELVCGVSSEEEIAATQEWIFRMHERDQSSFAFQVISMDVEDVKVRYYDTLRMAGKLEIKPEKAVIRTHLEKDSVHGSTKDIWKQVPGKIMFGNGISWTCLISLDLKTNERDEYVLEKMEVQEGILELLRDLPVSSGLAIRRDVGGVEEFYSLISGTEVRLERGFIDLTSLAILAGYKFHKNMTAMGVQVTGTLLNKTVSTGDSLWGLRWDEIPAPLQCYALGDIKFGFITYNVLAGILLRDLFPDPDVVCRYLECTQIVAVNWFLHLVMRLLEGVEYHPGVKEAVQTREEMIRSLRFRDAREKLCDTPPPYIRLWTEILGSWPALTNGGCRFLLQCRQWLPVQMRILARSKIQWADERMLRLPLETDLEYSRFGLTPAEIGIQEWINPVPGDLGMTRPPGIKFELLNFNIS